MMDETSFSNFKIFHFKIIKFQRRTENVEIVVTFELKRRERRRNFYNIP